MKVGERLLQNASLALITHKHCPDGSAAVVLARKIFPSVVVLPTMHQKVDELTKRVVLGLPQKGKLLLVDISCSKKVLTELLPVVEHKQLSLELYDHHETNSWLSVFKFPSSLKVKCVFDQHRCGAKLFYDAYLESQPALLKPYQAFIETTNDRDLWLQQSKIGDELARLHDLLGESAYIERFFKNPVLIFSPLEEQLLEIIKRKELQRQEKLLNNMKLKKDINQFQYGVVYGEGESSNLLNKALERHKLEYALLVNLNTKKVSLRGRGNMNCAEYAARYGGGGHRRASGFRIQFDQPEF